LTEIPCFNVFEFRPINVVWHPKVEVLIYLLSGVFKACYEEARVLVARLKDMFGLEVAVDEAHDMHLLYRE
jgi:hypothetical protein